MYKVLYSPRAKEDLLKIKEYLSAEFSEEITKEKMRNVTASIKHLEEFPLMGRAIGNQINVPTDYYYIIAEQNYVFYRNENNQVKIIRVLNHRQDFMRILFATHEVSSDD